MQKSKTGITKSDLEKQAIINFIDKFKRTEKEKKNEDYVNRLTAHVIRAFQTTSNQKAKELAQILSGIYNKKSPQPKDSVVTQFIDALYGEKNEFEKYDKAIGSIDPSVIQDEIDGKKIIPHQRMAKQNVQSTAAETTMQPSPGIRPNRGESEEDFLSAEGEEEKKEVPPQTVSQVMQQAIREVIPEQIIHIFENNAGQIDTGALDQSLKRSNKGKQYEQKIIDRFHQLVGKFIKKERQENALNKQQQLSEKIGSTARQRRQEALDYLKINKPEDLLAQYNEDIQDHGEAVSAAAVPTMSEIAEARRERRWRDARDFAIHNATPEVRKKAQQVLDLQKQAYEEILLKGFRDLMLIEQNESHNSMPDLETVLDTEKMDYGKILTQMDADPINSLVNQAGYLKAIDDFVHKIHPDIELDQQQMVLFDAEVLSPEAMMEDFDTVVKATQKARQSYASRKERLEAEKELRSKFKLLAHEYSEPTHKETQAQIKAQAKANLDQLTAEEKQKRFYEHLDQEKQNISDQADQLKQELKDQFKKESRDGKLTPEQKRQIKQQVKNWEQQEQEKLRNRPAKSYDQYYNEMLQKEISRLEKKQEQVGVQQANINIGGLPQLTIDKLIEMIDKAYVYVSEISGEIQAQPGLKKYVQQTEIFAPKLEKKEDNEFNVKSGQAFKVRVC